MQKIGPNMTMYETKERPSSAAADHQPDGARPAELVPHLVEPRREQDHREQDRKRNERLRRAMAQ